MDVEEIEARFMSHVLPEPNSGCWLWTGTLGGSGYGRFFVSRTGIAAHRYSWAKANNIEPPKDMVICHACDVRLCVNPDHLWLGTQFDNMRDASNKGRMNGQQKLVCTNGHELTPENTRMRTITNFGQRSCKECGRKWRRDQKRKKRDLARAVRLPLPVETLSEADIQEIARSTLSGGDLGRKLGVSRQVIWRIRQNQARSALASGGRDDG